MVKSSTFALAFGKERGSNESKRSLKGFKREFFERMKYKQTRQYAGWIHENWIRPADTSEPSIFNRSVHKKQFRAQDRQRKESLRGIEDIEL